MTESHQSLRKKKETCDDIEMDLTDKFGIATGWGASVLQSYRSDSRCDYHFGIHDPSHEPTELKKLNLK